MQPEFERRLKTMTAEISFSLTDEDIKELIATKVKLDALRAFIGSREDDRLIYVKDIKDLLGTEAKETNEQKTES